MENLSKENRKEDFVTIVFVRHAKTDTTGMVLPGRAPGLHLSEEGRQQAFQFAERLKDTFPVSAIYSSPLERALATAKPSAETLGLPVVQDPRLYECDFGDWTKAPLADLNKLPEWKSLMKHPETFRFPGGESFEELEQRLVSFITDMRAIHGGETVLAFSHADPIKVALVLGLSLGLKNLHKMTVSTASASVLLYSSQKTIVLSMNSQTHILDTHELGALVSHITEEETGN
ncbi:MAG: histidine phosphatase family protein [Firmicutes bacterium]|jgi:probable phosphoglycerate mutase|nr:histidine phosphatase family protein [Bacillota bacterium]